MTLSFIVSYFIIVISKKGSKMITETMNVELLPVIIIFLALGAILSYWKDDLGIGYIGVSGYSILISLGIHLFEINLLYPAVIIGLGLLAITIDIYRKKRKKEKRRILNEKYTEEKRKEREAYKESLLMKYNDSGIVNKIINNEIWLNMTEEQLMDSKGYPDDIDEKVTKTKKIETRKYGQIGKNRFKLKIKLVNGIVVEWDSQ